MSKNASLIEGCYMRVVIIAVLAMLVPIQADDCKRPGSFRLQCSRIVAEPIYTATFDAPDGRGYQEGNRVAAAQLFSRQTGLALGYWCELTNQGLEPFRSIR